MLQTYFLWRRVHCSRETISACSEHLHETEPSYIAER